MSSFALSDDLPQDDRPVVVLLPGRGDNACSLLEEYRSNLGQELFVVAVRPQNEWYPKPNGPSDQEASIAGLEEVTPRLYRFLDDKIGAHRLFLAGHSAGSVVALKMATTHIFVGAVAHNGCLLNPSSLSPCVFFTPVLLVNARDDEVFSHEQRVAPTHEALKKMKYPATIVDKPSGGHGFCSEDVRIASQYIKNLLSLAACTIP
jgi:predicted esterase